MNRNRGQKSGGGAATASIGIVAERAPWPWMPAAARCRNGARAGSACLCSRSEATRQPQADLDVWSKRLEGAQPAERQATLLHWQRDADLAGVRDADALKKLSAEEKKAWRKLWDDVAELLNKTDNAK
jgi:hypothetical protein